jgi:hypothetical protein
MNLVALTITVVVFEKLGASHLGCFGRWAISLTDRFPVSKKYLLMSRGTAIFQAVGFLCIGFSKAYGGVFVGVFIFHVLKLYV